MKCPHCEEREGTESFYYDPSFAMGWAHMTPQLWCKRCVATVQLEYAEKVAATIPALRAIVAEHDGR
jgi:hypothetical protein